MEVRSVATAKIEEITKEIETKLTAAEIKREQEIQKKLDFVKKEVGIISFTRFASITHVSFEKSFWYFPFFFKYLPLLFDKQLIKLINSTGVLCDSLPNF